MKPEEVAEAFLNIGVEHAAKSISDLGSFYPFGLRMDADQKVTTALPQIPEDKTPTHAEIMDLLWGGLHSDAKQGATAIGVFTDVGLAPNAVEGFQDGIELNFEHKEGYSETFLVPYAKNDDGFALGPLMSRNRTPTAFVAGEEE